MITQQTIYTTAQDAFAKEYPNYRWPKGDMEDQDPRFLRAMLMLTAGVNAAHSREMKRAQDRLRDLDAGLTEKINDNISLPLEVKSLTEDKGSAITIAITGWLAAFLLAGALILFRLTIG